MVSAPDLVRARAWRLLIATSGAIGVLLAAMQYDVWWTALSQLSSLVVAATYLLLAIGPRWRWTWWRGALATVMSMVCVGFVAMQHGNLLDPYSLFEHLLTPILVVVDYVLLSRGARAPLWHPAVWAVLPLPYLAWYVAADLGTYAALDPAHPAQLTTRVAALLALALVAGYSLRAACRPPGGVTIRPAGVTIGG